MTISRNLSFLAEGASSSGVLGPANGGAGVANNAAMTVTGSGNFAYTRTLTGTTNVTFPTTGTIVSTASTAVVTAPMLNGAQTGSAPIYGARAWCVFNGATTGTNAPTAGGNVSTVTRNSTGNYTINFTTAMPDANCAVVVTSLGAMSYLPSAPSASSATVGTLNGGTTPTDYAYVCVAVFR